MKVNKGFLTISIISGMALLYSRCINSSRPATTDVRGKAYAGSLTCQQCHADVYKSYLHTTHFQTSWAGKYMPGKISHAAGRFIFNDSTIVAIEKRDSEWYQVAYINGKESTAKRFEIGFGSGEKAFSFGYWQDQRLFQLPLSYFTSIHGWANSPGFPAQQANFRRPIIRRCFECHSSYIAEDVGQEEGLTQVRKLDKNSIIYGIDCERCHGPAASHVAFHIENPSVKEARYITRWVSLSRQQRLDACGVCHSGNDIATQRSTFSFAPGDTLSNFYYPEFGASSSSSASPDVHGKQAQLLAASRCFKESNNMECATCHNVHETTIKGIDDYSRLCTGCHKETKHTISGEMNIKNCIDCHMPKEASKLISFQVMGKGKADPYLLRTHRIAIYPGVQAKK